MPPLKIEPYTAYIYVGQLKVNKFKVLCQMSMKLPTKFDQNHILDTIVAKHILMNKAYSYTL